MATNPIPGNTSRVAPFLLVNDAEGLIAFLREAFGAELAFRMPSQGSPIHHAEVRIGGSTIMLADASAANPVRTAMLHVYVRDVDAVYRSALAAGASSEREPADQFYGDRSAGVNDRFGNQWWIASRIEELAPEEIERRARAAAAHG